MILHTVNKSPFHNQCLQQCISRCSDGDAVLLVEDGVYALPTLDTFTTDADIKWYVLQDDLKLRGLATADDDRYSCVDYAGWVNLCLQFDSVMAWY